MNFTSKKVAGVILAGGLARRMNGVDKGLVSYKGRPLVSFAIEALKDLADQIIINANRSLDKYLQFGLPILTDETDGFDGPLAGIQAAMHYVNAEILLVMPCDTPLIKAEHMKKLLIMLEKNDADVAVAFDGERLHPVILAINTCLKFSLQIYLNKGGRKVETWVRQQNTVLADFSKEPEIFVNINSLAELSELELKTEVNGK